MFCCKGIHNNTSDASNDEEVKEDIEEIIKSSRLVEERKLLLREEVINTERIISQGKNERVKGIRGTREKDQKGN